MGTMIFKPVSDVNTSSVGDWEMSNKKWTYAALLNSFDDDYVYMRGMSQSTGNFTIQMVLDESTLTTPSFQITNIRATGIYSAGKYLTTGNMSFTFDFCPNAPEGPLSFNLNLAAKTEQTNKSFSIGSDDWTQSGSEGNSVDGWSPLTLQVAGTHDSTVTGKNGAMSLDQLAIEIDYEPLPSYIYVKQNGSWVQCSNVYKKVNGVWVEQSTDFLGTSNISSLYCKGG